MSGGKIGCALAAALLCAAAGTAGAAEQAGFTLPGRLVETGWLDENLIEPELVVVDVRPRERYDTGHIPNAVHLDEMKLLSLATPEKLTDAAAVKSLLEAAGIGDGARVVAVDEAGGPSAALLWWLLGYQGFDQVSVLNGGQLKWQREGRASTREAPLPRAATFTPSPRAEWTATLDQLKSWRSQPEGIVIDARHRMLFAGAGGARAGHIPGAISIPWTESLNRDGEDPGFKPAGELAAQFKKAGITSASKVAVYGRSADQAAHVIFALALSGVAEHAANFAASFDAWANHAELPLEKSDRPAPSKAKGKASSGPRR